MIFDHSTYLSRTRTRLLEAIFLIGNCADEKPFAVPKFNFAVTASKLRFDRENARWSDDHMIDIEAIARQIMESSITSAA